MFRPPSLLTPQIVPTAANTAAGQPGLLNWSRWFGLRGIVIEEFRVRPSMGSVGDAYDNAMAESFFATRPQRSCYAGASGCAGGAAGRSGDHTIMSWDIALSEEEKGDYSACVCCCAEGKCSSFSK
jgi:hypothetical protein